MSSLEMQKYQRQYYLKNKTKVLVASKKRYWANPEKKLSKSREWSFKNKEKRVKKFKEYYLKNKIKINKRINQRRNKHKAFESYFARKFLSKFIAKDKCKLCSAKENLDYHHLDYNFKTKNIIVVCRSCHQRIHRGHTEMKI